VRGKGDDWCQVNSTRAGQSRTSCITIEPPAPPSTPNAESNQQGETNIDHVKAMATTPLPAQTAYWIGAVEHRLKAA
jgi:hypothetical protein